VARRDPIQGDLQEQVMRVMWKRDRGTVEDVRQALPKKHRGAYTTVQTILNRLVDRGLLKRQKAGKAFLYSAKVSEADYIARSLNRTLARASEEARRTALANLVGGLDATEMREINSLASEISRKRRKPS
jgi:predicted transcriptional regulator